MLQCTYTFKYIVRYTDVAYNIVIRQISAWNVAYQCCIKHDYQMFSCLAVNY